MSGPALLAAVAAIAAVSVVGAGFSLSNPLLALRMEAAGYSGGANGISIAVAGIATLVFAPFVPALAAWRGVRWFMLASLAATIVALLAFAVTAWDVRLWYPLRAFYSAALTGMFVTSEFAANALAPADRRGLWVGIYSTCLALGFVSGPLLLSVAGTEGVWPFVAGAVMFAVAGAPIAIWGSHLPPLTHEKSASPLAFVLRAPGLMSAAFVFGAVETGAMGLLPVHALRNGLSAQTGALLVAVMAAGNVLCQIPLGMLSDRVPRRLLLLGVSVFATLGALLLSTLPVSPLFAWLLALWSGIAGGLYMVGLAELGARYQDRDLAAANAAVVACYASGMLVGPPLAGRALDASPAHGMFLAIAAFTAVTLLVQLIRMMPSAR